MPTKQPAIILAEKTVNSDCLKLCVVCYDHNRSQPAVACVKWSYVARKLKIATASKSLSRQFHRKVIHS